MAKLSLPVWSSNQTLKSLKDVPPEEIWSIIVLKSTRNSTWHTLNIKGSEIHIGIHFQQEKRWMVLSGMSTNIRGVSRIWCFLGSSHLPQHAAVLTRHWPFMYRALCGTVVLSKTHVIVFCGLYSTVTLFWNCSQLLTLSLAFALKKKKSKPVEPVLQHADLCHSQLNKCSLSSAVLVHNNQCHGRNCINSCVTRTAKSSSVPHYALSFLESTFNEIKLQNEEKQTQEAPQSLCVLSNIATENLYICTIVSPCVYRQKCEFWYEKNEFRASAPIVSHGGSKIKVYFCSQYSIRPVKIRAGVGFYSVLIM